MGYASQTPTEYQHLTEKVSLAVMAQIAPLIGGGGPNGPLADAIARDPQRGTIALVQKLMAVDGISVESTDAALDAAVVQADSLALLRQVYGVG